MAAPSPSIRVSRSAVARNHGGGGHPNARSTATRHQQIACGSAVDRPVLCSEGGAGWDVRTEGEFDTALTAALADERAMNLIRVEIPLDDRSQTLDRIAAGLAKRVIFLWGLSPEGTVPVSWACFPVPTGCHRAATN